MAKEKLFTPEDFDKPEDKSFWQKFKGWIKKNKVWITGTATILIIAAIVLCCVFCGKTEEKEEIELEQDQTEQVAAGVEAQVNDEGSEAIEAETTLEPQETKQVEEQAVTAPSVETPKEEKKPEVIKVNTTTKSAIVSDNVEQEAMNVIRGDYGNVPERREKLGSKYQEIQNRVNQLKKAGVF